MRLHALFVSDDDGSRRTPISASQVAQWVDRANLVFADAILRLEFDPATGSGPRAIPRHGYGLDFFVIVPVPEPNTFMLAIPILGFASLRRRLGSQLLTPGDLEPYDLAVYGQLK